PRNSGRVLSSKARAVGMLFSRHSWWATWTVRPYSTRSSVSRAFLSLSRATSAIARAFVSPSRATSAIARPFPSPSPPDTAAAPRALRPAGAARPARGPARLRRRPEPGEAPPDPGQDQHRRRQAVRRRHRRTPPHEQRRTLQAADRPRRDRLAGEPPPQVLG